MFTLVAALDSAAPVIEEVKMFPYVSGAPPVEVEIAAEPNSVRKRLCDER
jgi:hypothetical protein